MRKDIRDTMKPCPFCGRRVENVSMDFSVGVTKLRAECWCGAEITIHADDLFYADGIPHQFGKSALDKWNSRAESEQTDCQWK